VRIGHGGEHGARFRVCSPRAMTHAAALERNATQRKPRALGALRRRGA
jgi:hypothetical protein